MACFPTQDTSGVEPVAIDGLVDDDFTESLPVLHHGVPFGALTIIKPRNDPMTPADRQLLADVAAASGLLLRNISLNSELEQRAADVRASRRRLIAARDAERHRLERDLHDGAQQQVVALKVKLGIARTIAQREEADEIVTRVTSLADETQQAVDALRAVAHGIYPPLLESEGLEAALRAVERTSPIDLTVSADGLGRYGRESEETVYFCVLETVERARMSGASAASAAVVASGADLVVSLDVGGSTTDLDLTSVTDRIDAAGGTFTVEERLGGETRITSIAAGQPDGVGAGMNGLRTPTWPVRLLLVGVVVYVSRGRRRAGAAAQRRAVDRGRAGEPGRVRHVPPGRRPHRVASREQRGTAARGVRLAVESGQGRAGHGRDARRGRARRSGQPGRRSSGASPCRRGPG